MKVFDMHCHIDLFPSMQTDAKKSSEMDMQILSMTTTPKAYEKEIMMLGDYNNIKIALGLHPQLVGDRFSELKIVERYLAQAEYIGEVGLDFGRQYYASKEKQMIVFDSIIRNCSRYGEKIISIHSVNSAKIVLDILEKYNCCKTNTCILHWYSGDIRQLKRAEEMGCYFSVNVKMLDSANGRKIINLIATDRILIESDAPFIDNINNMELLYNILIETIDRLSQYKSDCSAKQIANNSTSLFL